MSDHPVKHDAAGPPAYSFSNRITLSNQFGRHILGSSRIQPRSAFTLSLGNAEVGHYKMAVVSNKKVCGLYVSRDQSVIVDELYRANGIAIVETSIHLVQRPEPAD